MKTMALPASQGDDKAQAGGRHQTAPSHLHYGHGEHEHHRIVSELQIYFPFSSLQEEKPRDSRKKSANNVHLSQEPSNTEQNNKTEDRRRAGPRPFPPLQPRAQMGRKSSLFQVTNAKTSVQPLIRCGDGHRTSRKKMGLRKHVNMNMKSRESNKNFNVRRASKQRIQIKCP